MLTARTRKLQHKWRLIVPHTLQQYCIPVLHDDTAFILSSRRRSGVRRGHRDVCSQGCCNGLTKISQQSQHDVVEAWYWLGRLCHYNLPKFEVLSLCRSWQIITYTESADTRYLPQVTACHLLHELVANWHSVDHYHQQTNISQSKHLWYIFSSHNPLDANTLT